MVYRAKVSNLKFKIIIFIKPEFTVFIIITYSEHVTQVHIRQHMSI